MNEYIHKIQQYGSAYLLWLISCAIFLADMYGALLVIRIIAVALGADMWVLPAVQRCSIMALAVVGIIFFYLVEARYRRAAEQSLGRLGRLFAKVTAAQVGFLALSLGLSVWIPL